MKVKETFEIKDKYQTGHDPGLVVILDSLITKDIKGLVGRMATISVPGGDVLQLVIEEAKEHGPVNSLFFRNLFREDIPVGCEIAVSLESSKKSPSVAS